jgi:putative ABC transport system permease protein
MRQLERIAHRLRTFFRKEVVEQELSDEMRFHLERQVEENIASGMSPQEARRAATREFGGVEQVKEECRDARRANMLETLYQDLRYGGRILRKRPGFTIVAVLTLALGIGANIAIFSLVNALLLHPYDFRELDSLVRVWENRGIDEGADARWIAPGDAYDLFSKTSVFENFTTYREKNFNLARDGGVEPVFGCAVSASFFDVLGVSPALGRGFLENEQQPGEGHVVVLSHSLWQQRFGGDPAILGKSIKLNGLEYTVIGVTPPKFSYPVPSLLWVPLALDPAQKMDRASLSLLALGRLKHGVSVAKANAALAAFSRLLEREYPKTNVGRTATALQLRKELYLYMLPLFLLLQAAAGFVLLLACANLANLMFARMIGRQKEIAMRTALGAGPRRLAQLFVSETLLLALLAGTAAIAVSFWSVRLLRTSISQDWTKWVPGWDGIQVDRTVLSFTILLAIVVGLLFGFATVLNTNGLNLNKALKEAGPGSMTRAKGRLRSTLVVTQVVFALVLLVCAGLTIQGFVRLSDVYAGLQPADVLKVEIALPEKSYATNTRITNFYQQFLNSAAAIPGVKETALISNPPASNVDSATTFFTIENRPATKTNETPSATLEIATPGYFPALHIPLLAGRLFSEADTASVEQVVLISRSMAARDWPGEDPVGNRLKLGKADSNEPWLKIIGIIADVRQNWWNPPALPTIYRPFLQAPQRGMAFLLRSASNPAGYVSAVRDAIRQLDPDVSPRGINTLEGEVTDSIGIIRIMGILMGVFGLVALMLCSVGVYGVLSESVAQRTREIGIRLALGANPRDLMKMVLGQALRLTIIGLAFALPMAFAAGRLMGAVVFGIVRLDFIVLAGVAILLILVALIAGFFPARRALKIDPVMALRYE